MTIIRRVTEKDLPQEDRDELVAALKAWQANGVKNPTIPFNEDMNGDGIVDCFGLNMFGQLVFVKGVKIEDTVSESTGSGIETNRQGTDHG